MSHSLNNFLNIKSEVNQINSESKIIVVTKTFPLEIIKPIIDEGHNHFGENKVQEAVEKWTDIKNKLNNRINLHMIGKLQTNKAKFAVQLFDYIHSLDNLKLAKKISEEQFKIKKNLKLFIQVNLENERQKNGIDPEYLENFYHTCINQFKLNIVGLMCIPPQKGDVNLYFEKMFNINKSLGLKELSMGMSSDYLEALNYKATFIRVGSKIFGARV